MKAGIRKRISAIYFLRVSGSEAAGRAGTPRAKNPAGNKHKTPHSHTQLKTETTQPTQGKRI